MILSHRRMNFNKISHILNVNVGITHEIVHYTLHYCKKCARWLPEMLTEARKQARFQIYSELKHLFDSKGDNFFCNESLRVTKRRSIIANHNRNDKV
jgi:hypothetical protein